MCNASNSCAQSCVRLFGVETCDCLPGYKLASNEMDCTSTLEHLNYFLYFGPEFQSVFAQLLFKALQMLPLRMHVHCRPLWRWFSMLINRRLHCMYIVWLCKLLPPSQISMSVWRIHVSRSALTQREVMNARVGRDTSCCLGGDVPVRIEIT